MTAITFSIPDAIPTILLARIICSLVVIAGTVMASWAVAVLNAFNGDSERRAMLKGGLVLLIGVVVLTVIWMDR